MPAYLDSISEARAESLDSVRETRRTLKPFEASWRENSLPMPSEAPVTSAQEPLGPNLRSWGRFVRNETETELGGVGGNYVGSAEDEETQNCVYELVAAGENGDSTDYSESREGKGAQHRGDAGDVLVNTGSHGGFTVVGDGTVGGGGVPRGGFIMYCTVCPPGEPLSGICVGANSAGLVFFPNTAAQRVGHGKPSRAECAGETPARMILCEAEDGDSYNNCMLIYPQLYYIVLSFYLF